MSTTAQLSNEVDVLTKRFEQLEKRALSFVKVQGLLTTQIENQGKANQKAENFMKAQIKLQAKILEQLKKTTDANVTQIKTTDEFTESTKKASKATSELDKKLERVDNTATGFNKRNIILTKAINKYTFEQQRGFTLGIQSFKDYRKFGGNALEYVAEFLTATREEVQIFGMEAAKIRKVMYGFLPPGTFRLVNKVASTFQFLGGAMRNLTVEGEETNNIFIKLIRTFTAFTSFKSLKKIFDLRGVFPKKFPALKKLDNQIVNLGQKMKKLKEEGKTEEYESAKEQMLDLKSKRKRMVGSDNQKIFKDLTKATDMLMKSLGSNPKLKAQRERVESQTTAINKLDARISKAREVGDDRAVRKLGFEYAKLIEQRDASQARLDKINPDSIRQSIAKDEKEIRKLRFRRRRALSKAEDIRKSSPLGRDDPAYKKQMEKAMDFRDKETKQKESLKKNEEALAKAVPSFGKSFGQFTKAFGKFAKFSMSEKVKKLRKGLGNIVKGVGGIIKAVFMGFLKFFIAVSLILIAALAIKKLFEKLKVSEGFALVKEFFQSVKPIFVSLFERVKDGFGLILKAFRPGGTFKDLLLGLWKIVSGVIGIYFTVLGTLVMAGLILLGNFIEKQFTKIGQKVVDKFDQIKAPLSNILKVIRVITVIATAIAILASGAWIPGLVALLVGGIVVGIQTVLGKKLGLFAKGGTVNTPLQIVGEEGPELVTLPQGSRIKTASQTRKALSTSNQTVNNFNITVNARDSSREEMRRMANEISRIISRDIQRSTTSTTLG